MTKLTEIRALLSRKNLDAIYLTGSAAVYYLFRKPNLPADIIVTAGEVTLLVSKMFAAQLHPEDEPFSFKIIEHDRMRELAEYLQKRSVCKLGVTAGEFSLAVLKAVSGSNPQIDISDISRHLYPILLRKSDDDVMAMLESLRIAEISMEQTIAHLSNLHSEAEIARDIQIQFFRNGAQGIAFEPVIAWEANSAHPHHLPQEETKLSGAGKLLIDAGAGYGGFCSDITRMIYIGQPDTDFLHLYELVRTAKNKAVEAIKPGVALKQIFQIAFDYFDDNRVAKYFSHSLGHGIGRNTHEYPVISTAGEAPVDENFVLTVEPGLYIPGWGGIRLEDTVLVRADGAEVLNESDDNLIALRSLSGRINGM